MKRLIICIVIILLGYSFSFSQNVDSTFIKSSFKGDIYEYFGTHLTFPNDLLLTGIQGNTIISFRLNEKGILDSIDVIDYPDIKLAQEAANILQNTKNMWTSTIKNKDTIAYKYKIIVRYKIYSGEGPSVEESYVLKEKAEKQLKKGKYENAFELINRAILFNPFDAEYYLIRSKSNKLLNKLEESEKDYLLYKDLDKEIVAIIYVIGYGMRVKY